MRLRCVFIRPARVPTPHFTLSHSRTLTLTLSHTLSLSHSLTLTLSHSHTPPSPPAHMYLNTTHILPSAVVEVMRFVRRVGTGRAQVLAGDFNAEPHERALRYLLVSPWS